MNQEVEVTIYRFWNTYSVNTTQFRFVQGDSIVIVIEKEIQMEDNKIVQVPLIISEKFKKQL